MKNFNFINTLSDKKKFQLNQWKNISFFLLIILIIAIIFLHFRAKDKLNKLIDEKLNLQKIIAELDNITKQKKELENEKKYIQKKFNKLNNINNNLDKYLLGIANAIPDDSFLTSFEYDTKKGIRLIGYCNELQSAIQFMEGLYKLPFIKNIKLEHLKFDKSLNDQTKLENIENNKHEFLILIQLKKEN